MRLPSLAGPLSLRRLRGLMARLMPSLRAKSRWQDSPMPARPKALRKMSRPRAELPGQLREIGELMLVLRNPDFGTAVRIADAINAYGMAKYGTRLAHEQDQRAVELRKPARIETARFVAEIGDLLVEPDTPARVVMDSRSGTVVIGQDVQISTVAVTQGNLTVQIKESPVASQPLPFSKGRTVVTPNTDIDATQQGGPISIVKGTNLQTLVNGLNKIGLTPSGIIAILQAIKSAGALHAELIVQ